MPVSNMADPSVATLAIARALCLDAVPSLRGSRQNEVAISVIVMMTLAIIAVALRLWARRISSASFGIDDVFIIAALASSQLTRSEKLC